MKKKMKKKIVNNWLYLYTKNQNNCNTQQKVKKV